MNLTVSRNLESITPEKLPSARPVPGKLRLLCVGVPILGLRSFSQELERYCSTREDVEAVHITIVSSRAMKAMSRFPKPWDPVSRVTRMVRMWNRKTYGWFRPGGPVPLERFDAAIVCTQMYAGSVARLKREGAGLTLSVHIDATTQNTIREFGEDPKAQRTLTELETAVFAQSDLVTGMGKWASDSAQDDYGVPADRVLWIPPIAPVYEARERAPRKPGELPRMVFVGYDWVRKGGPELLKWHQKYFADRAELHFIGGGEKIDPATKPKNVVVHGRVNRDLLMKEVLPSMDFFVMPTKLDMSPWVTIEAMGHGMPVISSAIAGIPDMVIEGETGFLARPGDEEGFVRAIRRLIDDPELCRRMGETARQRVEREFTREVVYSKLIGRVAELVAQRREGAGRPAALGL